MKTNGTDASNKQIATEKKGTLGDWMNGNKAAFLAAIPKGTLEIDRFMQSAILALTNPKMRNLLNCSKESIYRSLKEAASYGLELNGTLGQAYLIPYNEKGVMTCHFQMGYKGLISLARRSNTIKTIAAECICENDVVDIELGMNRHLSHKIDITKERGDVIAYYCLVELINGGVQFCVKTKKDIEKHRDKFSKAYNPKDSENIWNKNFDAMALKTCVIQALKLCPISIEALEAVSKEEQEDIKVDESDFTVVDYNEPVDVTPAKKEVKLQEQLFSNEMSPEVEAMANQAFETMNNTLDNGEIF